MWSSLRFYDYVKHTKRNLHFRCQLECDKKDAKHSTAQPVEKQRRASDWLYIYIFLVLSSLDVDIYNVSTFSCFFNEWQTWNE